MFAAILCLSIGLLLTIIALMASMRHVTNLKADNARLSERITFADKEQSRLLSELEETRRRLQEGSAEQERQLELIAGRVIESHSKTLRDENSRELSQLLSPLKNDIERFKTRIEECYSHEARERFSLSEKIKDLIDANNSIGRQAQQLTTALQGNSKVQGDWGEMVLESILEKSGLRRDIEFKVQNTRDESGQTLRDNDGRLLRPDVVIYYPNRGCMVVDSKVSLTAFAAMVNADDESQRNIFAKQHLDSVVRHINELSGKQYQDYVGNEWKLDFVMMFIPNEGAYSAALQADPAIWQKAYDKRVVITSPTQLTGALRLVEQLWRHDRQTKNAVDIATRSGRLYDKFVSFVEDMMKVEKSLGSATASLDNAMSKLRTGRGNLISQAEKIKELGIKTSKQLPAADTTE